MSGSTFDKVLQATGFLEPSGQPAAGLTLADDDNAARLRPVFRDDSVGLNADAVFSAQSVPTSIFKDASERFPSESEIYRWHEVAWNIGVAPLLWIITPTQVRLYNCYASPVQPELRTNKGPVPLERFVVDSEDQLRELNAACGRLATETGAFWSSAIGKQINRRHRVDRELLSEIDALEQCLVDLTPETEGVEARALARDLAQRFIGRCIFTWYLLDRGLAKPFLPAELPHELNAMFGTPSTAFALFGWLQKKFNGDLFPMKDPEAERKHLTVKHLEYIREFVEGRSLLPQSKGQGRLFKFRFDAIPIELISSIYEQFARTGGEEDAESQSVHYTPVELVHLTLDPVFEGLPSSARVIDPACGSGAFLVEAFRRLVWRATGSKPASRKLVREILHNQLYGLDINRSALGIAAFSLYLAALELDEEPISDISDLKFEHLINKTLFETDTLANRLPRAIIANHFDAVVGNPPWTFVGREGKSPKRVKGDPVTYRPRRSPDQAFLEVGARLAGETGRIGMIMKATPFFSIDVHAVEARKSLLKRLAPTALVNLSQLRREDLFPGAHGPALLFFSRCRLTGDSRDLLVGSIPWTPDFKRTGVFHIGQSEIRLIPLKRALATPNLLKAAAFGTFRDTWLIEKLTKEFPRLDEQLDELNVLPRIGRGQGFIAGIKRQKVVPESHRGLLVLEPKDFMPFRLDSGRLEKLERDTLQRPRSRSIFRGPLILCPKGCYTRSAELGRYCVTLSRHDILYTQNLFGISLADVDPNLAPVLSAILNSSLTTFQLAFGITTWGIERPTVGPSDILSIRMPILDQCGPDLIQAAKRAEREAAEAHADSRRLSALDETVFDLYGLESEERVIVAESIDRARFLIFENWKERSAIVTPPNRSDLEQYAAQVAQTINAYLRVRNVRHVEAMVYEKRFSKSNLAAGIPGITVVRFVMAPGGPGTKPVVREGDLTRLEGLAAMLQGKLNNGIPPYLNERRQLRVYGDEDLLILKPTEVRYWTRTMALDDADMILSDHWLQRSNVVPHT
ncbi:MAG: SAM-dependent DNA methyltransferase [Gammaproteobacteria bacterium]|nr:SAM-dependent DNA methyltransferase [Gammaproteobacteria bacterium]